MFEIPIISFVNLLLFSVAVIGMTHIVVDSTIVELPKQFLKKILWKKLYSMLDCYQCAGTWCGFLCGAMLISHNPIIIFFCGCAGSFLAQWGIALINCLEAKALLDIGE